MREPIEIQVESRRYVLRQPSIADLSTYKRAVRRAGGRNVALGDKLLLIEAGLKAIAAAQGGDDPVIEQSLGVVADAKARLVAFIGDMQAGAFEGEPDATFVQAADEALTWSAELQHIASVVERHHAPYADALADAEVYPEIAGRVALELFLEAAEGLSAPVKRGFNGLAAETIDAVPLGDLPLIHARFQAEIQVSESEKKGSRSPTSGDDARSSSAATSTERPVTLSRPKKPSTSQRSTSERFPSTRNGHRNPVTTN